MVATKSATHFFDVDALEKEHAGKVKVWTDADEWAVRSSPFLAVLFIQLICISPLQQGWLKIGDPVLHIEVCSLLEHPPD